jgi:hypothetical protein
MHPGSTFPLAPLWTKLREEYAQEQMVDIQMLRWRHAHMVLGDVAYSLDHAACVMESVMWQREQRALDLFFRL